MPRTKYREKVSIGNYIWYLCVIILFVVRVSIFRAQQPVWGFIVGYSIFALVLLYLVFLHLKWRFILAEDSLLCKGTFRTKRIPYDSIKGVVPYELSYGIRGLRRRYYNEDIGKFYGISYLGWSRKGVLIEVDQKVIYGGKLFISPSKREQFVMQLMRRIG
jgi:hypothetical protein